MSRNEPVQYLCYACHKHTAAMPDEACDHCKKPAVRKHWRNEAKRLYDKCRDVPCLDCGNTFRACAMTFHHVLDAKEDQVSSMATACRSEVQYKELVAEIAKCVVLCSNCHRIRHDDLHKQAGAGAKRRRAKQHACQAECIERACQPPVSANTKQNSLVRNITGVSGPNYWLSKMSRDASPK